MAVKTTKENPIEVLSYEQIVQLRNVISNKEIDSSFIDKTSKIDEKPAKGFSVVVDDGTIPANPTGLTATAGIQFVFLQWTYNTETDMSHYEIWRNTTDDNATATKIAQTKANVFADESVIADTAYFYWIKAVDHLGNISGFNATAGSSATPRNVISGDIMDLSITETKLANAAVITSKLANLAVDNTKLANLAVDAAKLADSAVTATKIANLAVGSAAIANLAVGTAKIANLAVASGKIADLAVTNAKIADLAVNNAKISDLHGGKITANTVTADKINVVNLAAIKADLGNITAGTITMPSTGFIKGGQTAYNTGIGFFLGYDATAYKFSIGNPAGNYLTWDSSILSLSGIMAGSLHRKDFHWFTILESLDGFSTYTLGSGTISLDASMVRIRTGTTINSQARLTKSISYDYVDSFTWDVDREFRTSIRFMNNTSQEIRIRSGWHTGVHRHIGFKVIGNKIYGTVGNGTVETTTPVLAEFAAGSIRHLRVHLRAGVSADFYINENLCASITTNLPSTLIGSKSILNVLITNTEAANKAIEFSMWDFWQKV